MAVGAAQGLPRRFVFSTLLGGDRGSYIRFISARSPLARTPARHVAPRLGIEVLAPRARAGRRGGR
eukprot:3828610-Alexandrium_andersonii.AAC.1